MPSQRAMEQALNWLRSMAMDRNSMNGINAEICLNVIADLKRQNEEKGFLIAKYKGKRLERETEAEKKYMQITMDLPKGENEH